MLESFANFRNRLLGNAKFRSVTQKIPIIQLFARDSASKLFSYCSGFVHSQVLLAFVEAELPAALQSGAKALDELERRTAVPGIRLQALLRAAAALQLCDEQRDGRYVLGELGAVLIDNPGVIAMLRHHRALYDDLRQPLHFLRDTEFDGALRNYWAYAGNADGESLRPGQVSSYTELMAASQEAVTEQVLPAVDLSHSRHLLDVGGGNGSFAIAAAKRWPQLMVTVADLPAVAEMASASIAAAGLSNRVKAVGIDFRSGVLPQGHDVLSVVRILHDHDDDVARQLLSAAAASLPAGGRIVVAEPVADSSRAGRLLEAYFSVYLLAMGQGRLRRFEELRGMLKAAGFNDIRRHRTSMPLIASAMSGQR